MDKNKVKREQKDGPPIQKLESSRSNVSDEGCPLGHCKFNINGRYVFEKAEGLTALRFNPSTPSFL